MRSSLKVNAAPWLQVKGDDGQAVYLGLRPRAVLLLYFVFSLSALLPLIVYAYLGTFARYRADDYCATAMLQSSGFVQASLQRYREWTGAYSNLLFVQAGDWFGKAGMMYMPAATLILWFIGLTWLIAEIARASGLRWRAGLSVVLASLAIFLSVFRASNLFQVLLWRSSLVSYLAALVPLVYLAAFLLHELQLPHDRSRMAWSIGIVFVVALITGGTSETVDALLIGILLLSLLGIYIWRRSIRKEELLLIGTALLNASLAMLIMALSPGNLARLHAPSMPIPNLFSLGIKTLDYVFVFIVDTTRVSPLPALFSFLIPFLLFYGLQNPLPVVSPQSLKRAKWLLALLPLGMLVAIAFSFAPNAYARSFPSVYVRFPALFVLTLTLMTEGGLSGYLLSQAKAPSFSILSRTLVLGLLVLTFLYPVRAAAQLYQRIPKYRTHAAAWDARDQLIRQAAAQGETDPVVVQLDTVDGVQDYKGDEASWVNRCAADYYGLHTLRAP